QAEHEPSRFNGFLPAKKRQCKAVETASFSTSCDTWPKRGVNQTRFWQCEQNQEVRPPTVADFNAQPQRGHLLCFPRCVSSQDFGKRLKSVFNTIAFSST